MTRRPERRAEALSRARIMQAATMTTGRSSSPGSSSSCEEFAVDKVGARQLWADAGPAEPLDRLTVAGLGRVARAEQRLGPNPDASRPVGPASPGLLLLPVQGADGAFGLPGPGANLHDHPVAMACYATPEAPPRSRYNHGEVYAALRSPLAGACPDLQLFPVLLPVGPPGREPPTAGFALLAAASTPDSRGTVRLVSADPADAPLIDPGFLRDGQDTERLAARLALIRSVAAFPDAAEVWPGAEVRTDAGLRDYIRHTVSSYYHPAGTCRMGSGLDAVVDAELRVHGIGGLRIADASVLPVIPNAPLNTTVLAVAEKAADLIKTSS